MLNTISDISPRTQGAICAKLLPVAQSVLILGRFGQVDTQPLNETLTRKFRRYELIVASRTALVEGIPNAGQRPRYTDITVRLSEYGEHVEITNIIADTHDDNILQIMGERITTAMAVLKELNLWDTVTHGSAVIYCGTATGRDQVDAVITRSECRKAVRLLSRNKAMRITKMMTASALYGTTPIARAFVAVCHTDMIPDIKDIKGFRPVEEYASQGAVLPGEFGKVEEIRFCAGDLHDAFVGEGAHSDDLLCDGGAEGGDHADVYAIPVFGEEAYSVVPLAGRQALTLAVINPGKSTKDDPYGQRGLVAAHIWDASGIMNEEWIVRIESGCTASPA